MILISTDPATIKAVNAAGVTPSVFERIGQAAASGALNTAGMALLDRDALVKAAPLGRLDIAATTAVVLLNEPTDGDWALAEHAEVDYVVVLPSAGTWLAQQAA